MTDVDRTTDLHDRLGLLRADLSARIQPPPLAAVLHRSPLPRRRRLGAALATVAVVVVLAAGALLARAGRPAPLPATPVAPNRPSSTASQLGTPAPTSRSVAPATTAPATTSPATTSPATTSPATTFVGPFDMLDARHGFALISTCTGDDPCPVTSLAATQDGVHWTRRSVPSAVDLSSADRARDAQAPAVTALGPRSAFYQAAPTGPRSGFFTADAGVTWTVVPPGVNGTAASIPDGGVLQASCPSGGSDPCPAIALTVRLPGTGQLVRLARQPDLAVLSANSAPLGDGSWWVTGTRGGRQALAVSRDSGRSWATVLLPVVRGQYLFTSGVTGTGGQLWALAIGQLPEVKNGLLAVYRSTDDGRTWAVRWAAKAGEPSRSALGVAIVSGQRGIICDELMPQRSWSSVDGGATFTQTTCPTTGYPVWSAAGYVTGDGSSVAVSADGLHWSASKP